MVSEQILQRLEAEFDSSPDQIRAVADLLEAGASPEFVALFRRDETGDPGEERVAAIAERLRFLSELEARKATILQQAAASGHDVDALGALLRDSVDQDLLDDVDHFLRPHEHKAQAQVERLGLGPLVEDIHAHRLGDRSPQDAAAAFVQTEVEGLGDQDQVLAQVVLALAERYGEDPTLRARVRAELARGILTATAKVPGAASAKAEPTRDDDLPFGATAEDAGDGEGGIEGEGAAAEAESSATGSEAAAGESGAEDSDDPPAETANTGGTAEAGLALDQQDDEQQDDDPQDGDDDGHHDDGQHDDGQHDDGPQAEHATEPATQVEHVEPSDAPAAAAGTARRGARRKGGGGAATAAAGRYRQLLGLEEPVRRIPAGRMLALRHAEREGFLQLRLVLAPGREVELFRERFSPDVDPSSPLGRFLDLVYGHAYDRYVHRPCEHTVRHNLKEKADRETVRAFTRSLRSQLMSPVVEDAPVGAFRVAGKSAWLAIIGADGATKSRHNFPIPDGDARAELVASLAQSIVDGQPAAIAIPHGRREGPARRLLEEVLASREDLPRPLVVSVDETAAVVWATSPQARRRHAQSDTGMRTTLSLARRLRDPLFELMRVEPRGLGLGQNLTEVHQGMLKRQLDAALTSCLACIGIDVNRADPALLARAPGVSKELAKAIVQSRGSDGPFKTLEELRRVPAVDDATFLRIAGFLRVRGGDDPLDACGVPPEDRPLVQRIAEREGVTPAELLGRDLRQLDPREFIDERYGFLRVRDTFDALRRGSHDPRGTLEPFANDGVRRFDDLRVDQELLGRVTNLAEFGAFVDLGVGQDGLVHVSQIPGSRLRDPTRVLRVGEVVRVYVVSLDPKGRKIGLSMLRPRHLAEGRPATVGERLGGGARRRDQRRGRPEAAAVMTRAARAPEGRRGPRRGPKPPRPKESGALEEARAEDARDRRPGRGPRPGSTPRVITVESDKVQETQRGHKGELRSLSSLRALLGRGDEGEPADRPEA